MAKKIFGKRALALLMSFVMVIGMINIGVLAAGEPQLVKNYEDTYYKQNGSAGTAEDWEIHLSKQAAVTRTENVYDVTLTVETKDTSVQLGGATHGAVTLVLDVSNSMDEAPDGCGICGKSERHADHKGESNLCPDGSGNSYQSRWGGNTCVNCGQRRRWHVQGNPVCRYEEPNTHLEALQKAVADFLDCYVEDVNDGDKRLVSVVVFGTDAVTLQSWVDVTNATALANVKALVDALRTGNGAYWDDTYLTNGGTNIEAGLVLGRNLLNDSAALTGIPVDNQSLILFSDGAPTAKVGNVNSTSTTKVAYGGDDTGTQTDREDYDDIDNILEDISAATIAVQYNYEDENNVLSDFDRVINSSADTLSVDLTGEAGKVITTVTIPTVITDPMGEGVTLVGINNSYTDETWNLADYTPIVSEGITTYTITYQVEIDPTAIEADPDYEGYTILTPANGVTTLDYTVGEAGTPVEAEFNVPDIRGILPRFDLIVNYVDEQGADIAERIVETDVLYGKDYETEQKEIEHYEFKALAEDSDPVSGTITADTTVTYVYSQILYPVSYEYTGEIPENAPELPEAAEYAFGTAVAVADEPALEGYIFSGWDKDDFAMPAEAVIITGFWIAIPKYSVTYEYTGEIPADAPALPGAEEYEAGAAVVVADEPALEGYTFSGWDKVDFAMPAEDVVIHGSWTAIPKYTVTYEYTGDVPENAPALPGTAEYEAGDAVTVATDAYLEGYVFSGWDKENFEMPAENVVIRGSWTIIPPNKYNVVYQYEGEIPEGAPALPEAKQYEAGEAVAVAGEPALEGYAFSGWDKGDFTMPAEDVIIKGSWTALPKYLVSYEYTGEAPENAPALPKTVAYLEGAAVIVADEPELPGYEFSGWDKEDFTMPAEDVIITGSWTKLPDPTYPVSYEYTGDVPAGAPELPATAEYVAGSTVTVADAPTLEGYTFSGWDKDDFAMPAEAVVITGTWEKDPEPKYPVSYEYTGDVPKDAPELPAAVSYEAGAAVTVADEPWVEGYTFSGWDKEDFTMPAKAVVITGAWTKKAPPPPPVMEEWEGQFVLTFDKAVAGDPYTLSANDFTFELTDTTRFNDGSGSIYLGENANGIKHTYTARNDGSGKVEFAVPFVKDLKNWEDEPDATIPGSFVYTLTEVAGGVEGMTYDPTAYTILVQLRFTQVGLGWEYAVNKVSVLHDGETEVTAAFAGGSSVIHLSLGEDALYTNTYDDGTGALTINKVFAGRTVTTSGLAFRVVGPDSFEQVVPYADFTDGSYTLNGLNPGKYTVTEENAAVSGYRLSTTGEGEVEVTANEAAEITITNTYSRRAPYRPSVTPDPDPVTPDPDPVTPDPDPVTPDPDPVEPDAPIDIPDDDVPLIDEPDLPEPPVDIPDEEVPLADVPKTDDKLGLYVTLALLSGIGLAWLAVEDKKHRTV